METKNTKNEKQGLKVYSHDFAVFGQGLDSGIDKPIANLCVKIIKTFLPLQKFLSFSLTEHGWMDGRTDSQVDDRAHFEISL